MRIFKTCAECRNSVLASDVTLAPDPASARQLIDYRKTQPVLRVMGHCLADGSREVLGKTKCQDRKSYEPLR
jgi:hypothetical protein